MIKDNQKAIFALLLLVAAFSGCQQVQNLSKPAVVTPASLRDVPAQRLSYRFEADVLPPPEEQNANPQPEKLTAIQADFDQNRPQELLERTISSPDKQRVLAISYGIAGDTEEFRLDLYDAGGKMIRRITPETLALHFPETVVWSPDSGNFAFAGARRVGASTTNQEIVQQAPLPDLPAADSPDANVAPSVAPTIAANTPTVLTFRTKQIYIANRDGVDLKPLTQTDGLIYFYFVWSPDSASLAALGCREVEWEALRLRAERAGEVFEPLGRPRLLEKNGRERKLDDGLTAVFPVWSPDSSKLVVAFDKQIRIYDAIGNAPTAASIPLQVPLLLASKICDDKVAANQSCINAAPSETDANNTANLPTTEPTTFVPIIALRWTEDKTLNLQTGFIKEFLQGEPVRSYLRWHRLNLSPQAANLK